MDLVDMFLYCAADPTSLPSTFEQMLDGLNMLTPSNPGRCL